MATTPDGRFAGSPLNEGASPCLGADRNGPTAVLKSVSKMPNERMAGGQLLNMKFSPDALAGEDNLMKFIALLEASRILGNFHIQFNIVDSAELRDAQIHPENHQNLMVRVRPLISHAFINLPSLMTVRNLRSCRGLRSARAVLIQSSS